MFHLVPSFGEDGANLYLVGRVDIGGKFLGQGGTEIGDIVRGQAAGNIESLWHKGGRVGGIDTLFDYVAAAKEGGKDFHVIREIYHDAKADDVLHFGCSTTVGFSFDSHLMADGIHCFHTPKQSEHESAFFYLCGQFLL